MKLDISSIRKDYKLKVLDRSHLDADPIKQFGIWLEEAIEAQTNEPTAMCLSTVDAEGQPNGRIVLLKGVSENKFLFFTNYLSTKGNELEFNHKASLTFFWPELERQVRILGLVSKVDSAISDEYFYSRPIESRWGACASPQSKVIVGREEVETKIEDIKNKFGVDVKRPDFWGGYSLSPQRLEFWQGRESRLHDRLIYQLDNNKWTINRIAP